MKKQEFKNMRRGLGTSGATLNIRTSESEGCQRRKTRARNWKLIWTNKGKLPESGEGNRLPRSPGSSDSSKEIVPKEEHTKALIIKLPKMEDKERTLKAAREKDTVIYKGVPIRLSADFSKETLQARRGWKEVFQVMKGKDSHPRLLYPAKLSFSMERQIKCFLDKVKLKEFIITKPLPYEMLKGLI